MANTAATPVALVQHSVLDDAPAIYAESVFESILTTQPVQEVFQQKFQADLAANRSKGEDDPKECENVEKSFKAHLMSISTLPTNAQNIQSIVFVAVHAI
jgi:hypothetical protein